MARSPATEQKIAAEVAATETFDPFQHFVPNEERIPAIQEVRGAFRRLQIYLEQYCPPSRELSVAITNLETSAMWAIKSIVIQDAKQEFAARRTQAELESGRGYVPVAPPITPAPAPAPAPAPGS